MKKYLIVLATLIAVTLNPFLAKATIVVLVSTYDGFVVAADSRLTLSIDGKDRIASDSYLKIVRIGHSVGLAFSGTAFLYDSNNELRKIGSLIEDFKIKEKIDDKKKTSPEDIAKKLQKFLIGIYDQQETNVKRGILKLAIFGYDENKKRKIYALAFPKIDQDSLGNPIVSGIIQEQFPSGKTGSVVLGQQNVYARIIKGYDPHLLEFGLSEEQKEKLGSLRYDIKYWLMSLQDAIDLSVFIVRATIEAQRFNQKAIMGVGGEIDVAVVTSDEGFRWIQKKKLHVEGKEFDF